MPVPDGKLRLFPRLFSPGESERYLALLKEEIDWKSECIHLFGKSLVLPRMTAWFGDQGTCYTYSGLSAQASGWTRTLLRIRARVEEVTTSRFNSVLLNYYRDGCDSVSWHSDDEEELGSDPIVGSVSFGSERPFQMRPKANRSGRRKHAPQRFALYLPDGSYLEMGPGMQRNWEHQLPKRPRLTGERINLTFRRILSRPASHMP